MIHNNAPQPKIWLCIKKEEIYSGYVSSDFFNARKVDDVRLIYPSFTFECLEKMIKVSFLGEDIYRVAEQRAPLNGKQLFWRTKSGNRYTANISNGNGVIKKISFNFLLVNDGCFFSLCTPRKKRNDILENKANFYQLPFAQYLAISKCFIYAK